MSHLIEVANTAYQLIQGRVSRFEGSNKEEFKNLVREEPNRAAKDVNDKPSGEGFKRFNRPSRFGIAKRRDIGHAKAKEEERKKLFNEGKCYSCKQEGHKFYDCPNRKRAGTSTNKG